VSQPEKLSRSVVLRFWISTALFALQMGFTAYAQLRLPQVADAFAHLGFPVVVRVIPLLASVACFEWCLRGANLRSIWSEL
jgi:hypothetical protein